MTDNRYRCGKSGPDEDVPQPRMCRETVSLCCNSFLQQAGLNLLISMTVINNMLAKSVSGLMLHFDTRGSECAEGRL